MTIARRPIASIEQVDGLQTALDGKEAALGNPASSGLVLASTTAGVRSWVGIIDADHRAAVTGIHGIVQANFSTALGIDVMPSASGAGNSALGHSSLKAATSGTANTAVGVSSLTAVTTGGSNTAIGYQSGMAAVSVTGLTAVGSVAAKAATAPTDAFGYEAATAVTSGASNVAIGFRALKACTTSGMNTVVGNSAALKATSASNTAMGYLAIGETTSGGSNTALGWAAMLGNTTGAGNVAVGLNSGRYLADGTTANATPANATYLGNTAKASAVGATNEIVIGYNAIGGGSNTVRLGNADVVAWLPGATNKAALGSTTLAFKELYLHDGTDEWKVTINTSGVLTTTKV